MPHSVITLCDETTRQDTCTWVWVCVCACVCVRVCTRNHTCDATVAVPSTCVTWLIHTCEASVAVMGTYMRHNSCHTVWCDCRSTGYMYVIWPMSHTNTPTVAVLGTYVWHDCVTRRSTGYIRVTWLIQKCDVTHLYVCHDSLMRLLSVTWLICVTWLIRAIAVCTFTTWLIYMYDATHSCLWHDSLL